MDVQSLTKSSTTSLICCLPPICLQSRGYKHAVKKKIILHFSGDVFWCYRRWLLKINARLRSSTQYSLCSFLQPKSHHLTRVTSGLLMTTVLYRCIHVWLPSTLLSLLSLLFLLLSLLILSLYFHLWLAAILFFFLSVLFLSCICCKMMQYNNFPFMFYFVTWTIKYLLFFYYCYFCKW